MFIDSNKNSDRYRYNKELTYTRKKDHHSHKNR